MEGEAGSLIESVAEDLQEIKRHKKETQKENTGDTNKET
jgi:hypothetical protein